MFLTDITFMSTYIILFVGVPTFPLYHPCLDLFSCFLLMCLKNFKKPKYLVVVIYFLCMLSSSTKKNPKRFTCSSFACWELSRVNIFSRFFFSLLFACSRKPKTPKNISVCFSEFIFLLFELYRGEDHDENVEWLSYE